MSALERWAASLMHQSFSQTGDDGDRNNQSGYQHPILNVDAKDAESFDKRM